MLCCLKPKTATFQTLFCSNLKNSKSLTNAGSGRRKKVLFHYLSGPIQARQNCVSCYPFSFFKAKIDSFLHSLDIWWIYKLLGRSNQDIHTGLSFSQYKCNLNTCRPQVCQLYSNHSLESNTSHVENKSICKQFLNWSQCLFMGLSLPNNDLGHKAGYAV